MDEYKVIIADDEEDVIRAIMKKISWESLGFSIVGYAENGVKALELFEELFADVILTDIKMPYMDGLELTRIINEKYPTTKVVIFTGFDEFEYAKEAVNLEVERYILKPINAQELTEIMRKLKVKLDTERGEKRDIELLQKQYRKTLPMLRANFFSSLIQGKIGKADIERSLKDYEIFFSKPFYCVLVIHNSKSIVPKGVNRSILTSSVVKLAEEKYGEKWSIKPFTYLDESILIAELDSESKVYELTDDFEKFCGIAKQLLGATVCVGIGQVCSDLSKLSYSYEGAITAVSYRAIYGCDCAISINEISPSEVAPIDSMESRLSDLFLKVRIADKEAIGSAVKEYVNSISVQGISINRHNIYIMELISSINRFILGNDISLPEVTGDYASLYNNLSKMHPEGLNNWLLDICFKINQSLTSAMNSSTKSLVKKASEYIEANFKDYDISLEKVCKVLGVSQSYFSTIFKRETGQSFSSFLTEYRMKSAVKLLVESNLKSYVVANEVGYSDANYFSYAFKRYFGMSPSKYRTEHVSEA